jgi:hypothetical protein
VLLGDAKHAGIDQPTTRLILAAVRISTAVAVSFFSAVASVQAMEQVLR